MKIGLIIPLLIHSFVIAFCQDNFSPGFIISGNDQKITCLINDQDWKNNPSKIRIKLNAESPVEMRSIDEIKAFEIIDGRRFERHWVDMDRSSLALDKISVQREPKMERSFLFLEVLIRGEAKLFHYSEPNLRRFFYQVNSKPVQQLIYKKYKDSERVIRENNYYRQQLLLDLPCTKEGFIDFQTINYTKKTLVKYFQGYHQCKDLNYTIHQTSKPRKRFSLNLRPGIRLGNLQIDHAETDSRDVNFGTRIEPRIGIESELFLPFFNNRNAILFECIWHQYTGAASTMVFPSQDVAASLSSIEFSAGLRHYFPLSSKASIFLNLNAYHEILLDAQLIYENNTNLNIKTQASVSYGIGLRYQDRYKLEIRYADERKIIFDSFFSTQRGYQYLSMILSYALHQN